MLKSAPAAKPDQSSFIGNTQGSGFARNVLLHLSKPKFEQQ
jgi:hypothetical protein